MGCHSGGLLESSTHKHWYQRTDSNTSLLPQVEDITGYFLWLPGQAGIPVTPSWMQLSFPRFCAQ